MVLKVSIKKDTSLEVISPITIYDSNGKLVRQLMIKSQEMKEIDLTNLPSGLYFLHAHFSNGMIQTKRIIKN